jgi:type III secretion system PrgH/EprH family protein
MAEEKKNSEQASMVLRLLNSPLQGCEFLLPVGSKTLMIVGSPTPTYEMAAQTLPLPVDTLYIPMESAGVNFEILVADDETLTLIELSDNNSQQRAIIPNQPLHVGPLKFAIRSQNTPWPEDILQYQDNSPSVKKIAAARKHSVLWLIGAGVLMTIILVSYLLWNNLPRQVAELSSLLGYTSQRFQILPGRDNTLYVMSSDERDRSWANQVLARGDYQRPALTITEAREEQRINRWLADNYPNLSYYRLQLDSPQTPKIWISQQRCSLSIAAQQKLTQQLMAQLPYAQNIEIIFIDDAVASQQAEAGLIKQALPYQRRETKESITFIVQGELDDGQLLRIRQFIQDYHQQWGSRYVQFAVELKEDQLNGKSFKYGSQGYVKLNTGHWYFHTPNSNTL